MKKLRTPLLLTATFALFFSGRPAPKSECGSFIIIDDVAPYYFGIQRVVIYNWSTSQTTYYNNPTFPINYPSQGSSIQVQFYFDAPYHGAINLNSPCQMVNFHNESIVSIFFNTYCSTYRVELIQGDEYTHYSCP